MITRRRFARQRVAKVRHGGTEKVSPDATALVVGGGIAGLAAATVLAERGVQVTVIEKESFLGGRAGALRPSRQGDIHGAVVGCRLNNGVGFGHARRHFFEGH